MIATSSGHIFNTVQYVTLDSLRREEKVICSVKNRLPDRKKDSLTTKNLHIGDFDSVYGLLGRIYIGTRAPQHSDMVGKQAKLHSVCRTDIIVHSQIFYSLQAWPESARPSTQLAHETT